MGYARVWVWIASLPCFVSQIYPNVFLAPAAHVIDVGAVLPSYVIQEAMETSFVFDDGLASPGSTQANEGTSEAAELKREGLSVSWWVPIPLTVAEHIPRAAQSCAILCDMVNNAMKVLEDPSSTRACVAVAVRTPRCFTQHVPGASLGQPRAACALLDTHNQARLLAALASTTNGAQPTTQFPLANSVWYDQRERMCQVVSVPTGALCHPTNTAYIVNPGALRVATMVTTHAWYTLDIAASLLHQTPNDVMVLIDDTFVTWVRTNDARLFHGTATAFDAETSNISTLRFISRNTFGRLVAGTCYCKTGVMGSHCDYVIPGNGCVTQLQQPVCEHKHLFIQLQAHIHYKGGLMLFNVSTPNDTAAAVAVAANVGCFMATPAPQPPCVRCSSAFTGSQCETLACNHVNATLAQRCATVSVGATCRSFPLPQTTTATENVGTPPPPLCKCATGSGASSLNSCQTCHGLFQRNGSVCVPARHTCFRDGISMGWLDVGGGTVVSQYAHAAETSPVVPPWIPQRACSGNGYCRATALTPNKDVYQPYGCVCDKGWRGVLCDIAYATEVTTNATVVACSGAVANRGVCQHRSTPTRFTGAFAPTNYTRSTEASVCTPVLVTFPATTTAQMAEHTCTQFDATMATTAEWNDATRIAVPTGALGGAGWHNRNENMTTVSVGYPVFLDPQHASGDAFIFTGNSSSSVFVSPDVIVRAAIVCVWRPCLANTRTAHVPWVRLVVLTTIRAPNYLFYRGLASPPIFTAAASEGLAAKRYADFVAWTRWEASVACGAVMNNAVEVTDLHAILCEHTSAAPCETSTHALEYLDDTAAAIQNTPHPWISTLRGHNHSEVASPGMYVSHPYGGFVLSHIIILPWQHTRVIVPITPDGFGSSTWFAANGKDTLAGGVLTNQSVVYGLCLTPWLRYDAAAKVVFAPTHYGGAKIATIVETRAAPL